MSASEHFPIVEPHEPDEMGVWSDGGDIVWLPRSQYPKRIAAIRWAMDQWGVTLPEVACLSRWLRYEPHVVGGFTREDGTDDPGWSEDRWYECEQDALGAFRAWRLESA